MTVFVSVCILYLVSRLHFIPNVHLMPVCNLQSEFYNVQGCNLVVTVILHKNTLLVLMSGVDLYMVLWSIKVKNYWLPHSAQLFKNDIHTL